MHKIVTIAVAFIVLVPMALFADYYNPCGIIVGKEAYFKMSVRPDDYPDANTVKSGMVRILQKETFLDSGMMAMRQIRIGSNIVRWLRLDFSNVLMEGEACGESEINVNGAVGFDVRCRFWRGGYECCCPPIRPYGATSSFLHGRS